MRTSLNFGDQRKSHREKIMEKKSQKKSFLLFQHFFFFLFCCFRHKLHRFALKRSVQNASLLSTFRALNLFFEIILSCNSIFYQNTVTFFLHSKSCRQVKSQVTLFYKRCLLPIRKRLSVGNSSVKYSVHVLYKIPICI